MLEFLLFILLVGILLFIFSPSVRALVIMKVMQYIFGRIAQQAEANQRAQGEQRQRQNSSSEDKPSDNRQKQDLNEIEARGFDKKNSDEYVDFEEIK